MIRKYRNELCTLVTVGILTFHVLEIFFKFPTNNWPDIYRILNNLISLGFFSLFTLYVHCLMLQEMRKYAVINANNFSKKFDVQMPEFAKQVMDMKKEKPKATGDESQLKTPGYSLNKKK